MTDVSINELLMDLRDTVDRIERFTGSHSYDDYLSDEMLRHAVERNLITIGEVLIRIRDIDMTVSDSIPGSRALVGLRNRLAHGYDTEIDDRVVWDGLMSELPKLSRAIDQQL